MTESRNLQHFSHHAMFTRGRAMRKNFEKQDGNKKDKELDQICV